MHPRTLLTIHERQHASRQIILGHPLAVRGGVQDSRCAVPGMSAPAETLKGSSLSLRHLRPPLQLMFCPSVTGLHRHRSHLL